MSILRICPRPAHAAQQIRPRGRLSDDFAEPPALPPSKRHHMRHEKEMHRRAKSNAMPAPRSPKGNAAPTPKHTWTQGKEETYRAAG
eukprot:CAMPEP_0174370558 /NCGR_PEP_ID=MMETSP0811_2-20130205/96526_1 /TAXON_ID=73025 ORGANISM="Eutreptiella gymnastica-like, Strain CCMP1594" /NCGR_SAMPLE_ID=MMETSP0811_2 /ASSEMBLY_ACC=CAM_ASM_000667 /LENGTH=86 /DNA_ID=CAMNT_0015516087 /DNA_START=135 /DNA_END=396 /DNA_ORIENTATION=-